MLRPGKTRTNSGPSSCNDLSAEGCYDAMKSIRPWPTTPAMTFQLKGVTTISPVWGLCTNMPAMTFQLKGVTTLFRREVFVRKTCNDLSAEGFSLLVLRTAKQSHCQMLSPGRAWAASASCPSAPEFITASLLPMAGLFCGPLAMESLLYVPLFFLRLQVFCSAAPFWRSCFGIAS